LALNIARKKLFGWFKCRWYENIEIGFNIYDEK
jgi:hypothetical protein